ncbi:MAG: hypothetical protein LBL75_01800 [Rickettsiales bacterium]|jgi:hypothetical protein|nr:hypothetical protein [Rickettsiales bacterium]
MCEHYVYAFQCDNTKCCLFDAQGINLCKLTNEKCWEQRYDLIPLYNKFCAKKNVIKDMMREYIKDSMRFDRFTNELYCANKECPYNDFNKSACSVMTDFGQKTISANTLKIDQNSPYKHQEYNCVYEPVVSECIVLCLDNKKQK